MLSNFSVRKPYTIVVGVILIIILGFVSYFNMTTDLLPDVNLPVSAVITTYPGASPEEVESKVTRPIEQSLASVSNVTGIQSISQENMSVVIVEFTQTTNMDSVIIEMRESLDMINSMMPENSQNPMIMKFNPEMMPIMVTSGTIEGKEVNEFSSLFEDFIIPEIESVEGVASVSASGLTENIVNIVIDDEKIDDINKNMPMDIEIDKEMVSGIIKGNNLSMPVGYVSNDKTQHLIRVGEEFSSIDELKSLEIMNIPMGNENIIFTLEDIADFVYTDSNENVYSKVNNNNAVIFNIQKQAEYATTDVSNRINLKLDDLSDEHEGLNFVTLMDQGEYIDIVVSSISKNLVAGGILAIIILFIFLRDMKPTIIIGFAIPISIITAFVMMYFGNITLNIISLGGLAIGVGMLVDNGIVVIENIYRMRAEGKSAEDASIEGAKQVSGAIIASTLTTISVFLPIVFTEGLTRELFADMGLTIAFSLIASLMISLTLVPMMASNLIKKDVKKDTKLFLKIKNQYSKLLKFSLRHRWTVIVFVLILFIGSIYYAFNFLGVEFFPASDSGQINARLDLEEDEGFEAISSIADDITDILLDFPDVRAVGANMGSGDMMNMAGSTGSSDHVNFNILLNDDRNNSTNEVLELIRTRFEGEDYNFSLSSSDMDMGGSSGGIAIEVIGRDLDEIMEISKDIGEIISSVEGTINVDDGIQDTEKEYRIIVDKNKALSRGITVGQVLMEVSDYIKIDSSLTSIFENGTEYEIYIMDSASGYKNLGEIEKLEIEGIGGSHKLLDLANIEEAQSFTSIQRKNQQRYNTVRAEVEEGYNIGHVSQDISDELDNYNLKDGYEIVIGGEIEDIQNAFIDLFLMLVLGILFIYLIMVAQFQSLLSPFIVMFTIPLAFTGGIIGLIITNNPISVISLIGLIILTGVVVNNGIVFVDYINKMREDGMNKYDAIIKTGLDRIRPIFMTALTTIFALSTISLGAGTGTEMMQPMAITAIGGLIYATILTLLFIPVLYDIFNKKTS